MAPAPDPLTCVFTLALLATNDTGEWGVTMGAVAIDNQYTDDHMAREVVVGRQATSSLAIQGETNSSWVEVEVGEEVRVECLVEGGRPEVGTFTWHLTHPASWEEVQGVTVLSSPDPWGYRASSQARLLTPTSTSTSTLTCTPIQVPWT